MSYGPNVPAVFRRLAEFVDRILKGGNPAEIPIEQVSRVDFLINLRTAPTLGITISPALVARDKVGYAAANSFAPIGSDQLCYQKDGGGWKIAGYIGVGTAQD